MEDCVICYEEKDSNLFVETVCGHRYCGNCLLEWSKRGNICPLCVKPLKVKEDDNNPIIKEINERKLESNFHFDFLLLWVVLVILLCFIFPSPYETCPCTPFTFNNIKDFIIVDWLIPLITCFYDFFTLFLFNPIKNIGLLLKWI
jgi:E3 ubiquitin-protein ligase RHF